MATKAAERIKWECKRAEWLVGDMRGWLKGTPKELELASLGDELVALHAALLPLLEAGTHKNPVHHTAHVLRLMVEIMGCELRADPPRLTKDEFRLGCFIALCHDAGNAFEPPSESKIRVSDVRDSPERMPDALEQRKRHMRNGGPLAKTMLLALAVQDVGEPEANIVRQVVEVHDNPTVAELLVGCLKATDPAWICLSGAENLGLLHVLAAEATRPFESAAEGLKTQPAELQKLLEALTAAGRRLPEARWSLFRGAPAEDEEDRATVARLAAIHREADRLWMLTPEGVAEDVWRDREKNGEKTAAEMIKNNVKRHRQERELYEILLGADETEAVGMDEGGFYRTERGKTLYEDLQETSREFYGETGGTPGSPIRKRLVTDPESIDRADERLRPFKPKCLCSEASGTT